MTKPDFVALRVAADTYATTSGAALDQIVSLLSQVAAGVRWTSPPIGEAPVSVQYAAAEILKRLGAK